MYCIPSCLWIIFFLIYFQKMYHLFIYLAVFQSLRIQSYKNLILFCVIIRLRITVVFLERNCMRCCKAYFAEYILRQQCQITFKSGKTIRPSLLQLHPSPPPPQLSKGLNYWNLKEQSGVQTNVTPQDQWPVL